MSIRRREERGSAKLIKFVYFSLIYGVARSYGSISSPKTGKKYSSFTIVPFLRETTLPSQETRLQKGERNRQGLVVYTQDFYTKTRHCELMKPQYFYRAKLKRVVDGDTMDLVVDAGFYISVHERFRLKDIDTPEIFGVNKESEEYKKGLNAREYVKQRFAQNEGDCIVESYKTGVYGRWIGVIWFPDSDVSLNQDLLDRGLAMKYKG